jgi:hypothetical protein
MKDTIKILGYKYVIKTAPPVEEGGMAEAGKANMGRQLILIDPTNTSQQIQSTVLHEAIEALNYHFDMNLNHNIIMQLEAGIFQVIQDNPGFFDKEAA